MGVSVKETVDKDLLHNQIKSLSSNSSAVKILLFQPIDVGNLNTADIFHGQHPAG